MKMISENSVPFYIFSIHYQWEMSKSNRGNPQGFGIV